VYLSRKDVARCLPVCEQEISAPRVTSPTIAASTTTLCAEEALQSREGAAAATATARVQNLLKAERRRDFRADELCVCEYAVGVF